MSDPNPQPFSLNEARDAARDLASARRRAEKEYRDQIAKAADAEAVYRKAYAQALIGAEAGTVTEREAVAKEESADLARDRDFQAGLSKACLERLRGLEGERAALRLLCEWSMRIDTQLRDAA